ncbi:MAG: metal ABC transporter ATP-binding protein, partial [Corynebacterium sp.]|nr:metal ABC transporter ATP-binding protein [Corynebacterium sp.]
RAIAYIEQRSDLDRNFPTSVFDTVLMGTYPRLGLFHRPGKAEREAATQALKDVDMWDFRHRHISELSGGQFQRVLFARAIVQDAEYIFLDEPFVGIDVPSEKTIVTLLRQMADAGKHVVVVHHDMNTVRGYYNDLIVLNGELVAAGPTEEVFVPDVLQKAFGALVIREPSAPAHPTPRQAALQEETA